MFLSLNRPNTLPRVEQKARASLWTELCAQPPRPRPKQVTNVNTRPPTWKYTWGSIAIPKLTRFSWKQETLVSVSIILLLLNIYPKRHNLKYLNFNQWVVFFPYCSVSLLPPYKTHSSATAKWTYSLYLTKWHVAQFTRFLNKSQFHLWLHSLQFDFWPWADPFSSHPEAWRVPCYGSHTWKGLVT